MVMKFENKKLDKDDHAKIDRDAGVARKAVGGIGGLVLVEVVIRKVPWKKVSGAISKVIFKD